MPLKNSIPLRTETFVVQGAGKGADGRSFDNAWKLPKEERAKLRSKTFPGIAKAMAEQWT